MADASASGCAFLPWLWPFSGFGRNAKSNISTFHQRHPPRPSSVRLDNYCDNQPCVTFPLASHAVLESKHKSALRPKYPLNPLHRTTVSTAQNRTTPNHPPPSLLRVHSCAPIPDRLCVRDSGNVVLAESPPPLVPWPLRNRLHVVTLRGPFTGWSGSAARFLAVL